MLDPNHWNHAVAKDGAAHICNCIGCCRKCGGCITAPWHTPAYCDLTTEQVAARARLRAREQADAQAARSTAIRTSTPPGTQHHATDHTQALPRARATEPGGS